MNALAKNSKNIYRMDYHIEVPVSEGLTPLLKQIVEIRSEFGLEPDKDFGVLYPVPSKKTQLYRYRAMIRYSHKDALAVLSGRMSEDEYILRNIVSSEEKSRSGNFAVEDIF